MQASRDCWKIVDRMIGRKTKTTNINSTVDPKSINTYFQSINSVTNYTTSERVVIPEGIRLLLAELYVVEKFLNKQKTYSIVFSVKICLHKMADL